jgi:hypothetical protein
MSNTKTPLDEIVLQDLEDGSSLRVFVESCTEVGNAGKPGLQVHFLGYIVCFEPLMAAKLAYQARKQGQTELFLEDRSWAVHQDQFVRLYLELGTPPQVRVEVKTRSRSKPLVKRYALPFELEAE